MRLMTQSGLICKVLGLAFCGIFLIGFETARGSGAASPIPTEADPISETKKVVEKTELPPAIHPNAAASRPERFSAQLEKPGSPQTATGISEQAPQIVPLELPPPAVSSTRPGFTARGYTSRW